MTRADQEYLDYLEKVGEADLASYLAGFKRRGELDAARIAPYALGLALGKEIRNLDEEES